MKKCTLIPLIFLAGFLFAKEGIGKSAVVITREIQPSVDHNHCTTRQFQHKTFWHEGVWFVFYSDGKDFWYQTSADSGKTWKKGNKPVDQAPNGSSSFDLLKIGDSIYLSHAYYPLGRYDPQAPYATDPTHNKYPTEGRIKKGVIKGREIVWLQDINPGFVIDYSNFVQDEAGYFWVFTRRSGQGIATRSSREYEISEWQPGSICMPVNGRHAMDAAALDRGKLFVVSMLTSDGKLYGNLYDGETWGAEAVLIDDKVTTVAGDDRRLSLEFDPVRKRLHLVYVDAGSILRYRYLDAPYNPAKWIPKLSDPGLELASGIFTSALSLDTSDSDLMITYGLEKHLGQDKRVRTGELFTRHFKNGKWQGKPILISQPGTVGNWYPSVNRDISHGLCVLYSRSVDGIEIGKPLAVMVSVWQFNDN